VFELELVDPLLGGHERWVRPVAEPSGWAWLAAVSVLCRSWSIASLVPKCGGPRWLVFFAAWRSGCR